MIDRWSGLPADIVIVWQIMVAMIAMALGYATANRSHIAIDLLYNALPAPFRKGCNLLALLVGLVAFGPLSAFAYEEFTLALVNGDFIYGKLQLPEWPAAGAFFVGLLVMNLRLLLLFARDMMTVGPYDAAGKGGG